jgi:transposase-like protein
MAEQLKTILETPVIAASDNRFSHLMTNCFKCGSSKLKIVFQSDASKIHSFLHCQDCQMRERIT